LQVEGRVARGRPGDHHTADLEHDQRSDQHQDGHQDLAEVGGELVPPVAEGGPHVVPTGATGWRARAGRRGRLPVAAVGRWRRRGYGAVVVGWWRGRWLVRRHRILLARVNTGKASRNLVPILP